MRVEWLRMIVAGRSTGWCTVHTHSEPYPSATDVAAAVDPHWHYVIVSLKRQAPEMRSYRIADGEIIRRADRGSLIQKPAKLLA